MRRCDSPKCKVPATDRMERVAGLGYRVECFCEKHADERLIAGQHVIVGKVSQ